MPFDKWNANGSCSFAEGAQQLSMFLSSFYLYTQSAERMHKKGGKSHNRNEKQRREKVTIETQGKENQEILNATLVIDCLEYFKFSLS